jgi:hypothetical protein
MDILLEDIYPFIPSANVDCLVYVDETNPGGTYTTGSTPETTSCWETEVPSGNIIFDGYYDGTYKEGLSIYGPGENDKYIYKDVYITSVPTGSTIPIYGRSYSHDASGTTGTLTVGVPLSGDGFESEIYTRNLLQGKSFDNYRYDYEVTDSSPDIIRIGFKPHTTASSNYGKVHFQNVIGGWIESYKSTVDIKSDNVTPGDKLTVSTIVTMNPHTLDTRRSKQTIGDFTIQLPPGSTIPETAKLVSDTDVPTTSNPLDTVPVEVFPGIIPGEYIIRPTTPTKLESTELTLTFDTSFSNEAPAESMVFVNYEYANIAQVNSKIFNVWGMDKTNVEQVFTIDYEANMSNVNGMPESTTAPQGTSIDKPTNPTRQNTSFLQWIDVF